MDQMSPEQVRKIALLGRLKLSDTEIEQIGAQLSAILTYVEQLSEVDTASVEPMAHPLPLTNVFREDETRPSLSVDDALANAPKRIGDFYSVPQILEDRHA